MKKITINSGKEVEVKGVSPLMIQKIESSLEADRPKPKVPQYKVESFGGVDEWLDHNEKTLTTDEEKAQWQKYQEAMSEWNTELNNRVLRAIALRGVHINPNDIVDTAEWIAEQKAIGIHVPDDPTERRIHYFETEIVSTPEDILDVISAVMMLSGIDRKEVEAAKTLFRGDVEEPQDNVA